MRKHNKQTINTTIENDEKQKQQNIQTNNEQKPTKC